MLSEKPITITNTQNELTRLEVTYKAEQAARAKAFQTQRRKLKALLAALKGELAAFKGEQPEEESDEQKEEADQ